MSNASSRRRGFSLIELLVVIAIIAILVSLLMAGVQKARSAAARISCSNNMHQVALAMHLVVDATGALPQGAAGYSQTGNYWGHGSWQVPILPFIEQENVFALYQGYDQAK
jgi:prepilin-type N-terminal cleavage/methylation domain-containing protein